MYPQKSQARPDILGNLKFPEVSELENGIPNELYIRELIPNINTEGLNFAGNSSWIPRNVGLNRQTPFADILCGRISLQIEDWPALIKDQIVVDLCAGWNPFGYYLACTGEAKAYIGVEAYVADSLFYALSNPEELLSELKKYTEKYSAVTGRTVNLISKLVVTEDAATFMERITAPSVSVFTIGMHSLLEDEQCNRLDKAIPLALGQAGCVVAYPEPVCCGSRLDFYCHKPLYVARSAPLTST